MFEVQSFLSDILKASMLWIRFFCNVKRKFHIESAWIRNHNNAWEATSSRVVQLCRCWCWEGGSRFESSTSNSPLPPVLVAATSLTILACCCSVALWSFAAIAALDLCPLFLSFVVWVWAREGLLVGVALPCLWVGARRVCEREVVEDK